MQHHQHHRQTTVDTISRVYLGLAALGLVLFIVLGNLLAFKTPLFQNLFPKPKSSASTVLNYDVTVVGGGTGGIAAAIQAARSGAHTVLLEPTDWLGGQLTSAGVSTIDEGMNFSTTPASAWERQSGIYGEFVNNVAAKYGGVQNLHKCYYGDFAICVEPHIAQQVLTEMVNATPNLEVKRQTIVTNVLKAGNTITGVLAKDASGATTQLNSSIVIDATEYGDVIPLTGAAYRVGKDLSGSINPATPIQDITYTAVIQSYPNGIPSNLRITTPPPGYDNTIAATFAQKVSNTSANTWTSTPPNDPFRTPKTWINHTAYRGLPDVAHPSSTNDISATDASQLNKTVINFANDYPVNSQFIEDPNVRQQVICQAKLRTIQFLYYMQTQGQSWSVGDTEGYQNSSYQASHLCANIPTQLKDIEKRLALIPYVREARRIVGTTTLTSPTVITQKATNLFDPTAVKGVSDSTAIALGAYATDMHGATDPSAFDQSIDRPSDVGAPHAPFQVPLGTLIPQSVDGFLVAEKNLSSSRIANSALREQPVTMTTGQAAGALAAIAAKKHIRPRDVKPLDVQLVVANAHAPLALYQFHDVTQSTPNWPSIQIAANYNILTGFQGNYSPNTSLTRGDTAFVIDRLFGYPYNGTQDDAINQLRAHGLTTSLNNTDYKPNDPMLKGQLALMIARGLGQNPLATDAGYQAMLWLQSQGISVSCTTQACLTTPVLRHETALAAAGTLYKMQVLNQPVPTIGALPPANIFPPLTPTPTPTPTPALPTCTGAHPESTTTAKTSGTFLVYATGVKDATWVKFATWSSANGQDDLIWYNGTNQGGGSWTSQIDLAKHPISATDTQIYVHVYMGNDAHGNIFCSPANFIISLPVSTPTPTKTVTPTPSISATPIPPVTKPASSPTPTSTVIITPIPPIRISATPTSNPTTLVNTSPNPSVSPTPVKTVTTYNNIQSLSLVLANWDKPTTTTDFNHDGTTDILDLSHLLANWGT